MSEKDDGIESADAGEVRKISPWLMLGFALVAVAFGFYLRLFLKAETRIEVIAFFLNALFPAAILHSALFLLLTAGFRIRARGALLYWGASALVLVYLGGWTSAQALILIILFGFACSRIGNLIARRLLPVASQGWGVSLGIGILLFPVAGALLAWIHLFKWWTLAILMIAALIPDFRSRAARLRGDIKAGWQAYLAAWDLAFAFSLQALFLLGAYAFVAALAPETNSDAVRFYWPYMKLLRYYSGFFDGPRQWAYIIPQAGLVYGSAVLSLLGKHAVRLSMLLAWASLIGMMGRRWLNPVSGARYALAIVIASCPVILWITGSLMQDSFVSVAVVVLAVLCLEGRDPGAGGYWAAVGICLGVNWAAKYSVLAYSVPLIGYAIYRSLKAAGWLKTIRGLLFAGLCALATLLPWFVHSYRQSGNPIFPFLLKIFPAPLWPRGVGFANLENFRLAPGWKSWLLWPIDMTYTTGKFVEGYDGKLGLVLVVIVILAVAALWKGTRITRALAISGVLATALLWTQTSYLRYWLPTLWLLGIAGSDILQRHLRPAALRAAAVACAFVILIPQVLFSMINYWPDGRGWPWSVYTKAVPWQDLAGGGLSEIERLLPTDGRFPKVWFTGYEPVGHLQVQPMEAVLWEMTFHTTDPRSKLEYLTSAGCEYWVVNEEDQDALWFRGEGISHFFWNQDNLFARSGPIAIYRMPAAEKVLREFDSRAAVGTDLVLNGGFEEGRDGKPTFWFSDGEAKQVISGGGALEGQGFLQLRARGGMRQGIALPPGVKSLEVAASARAGQESEPAAVHYVFYFLGFPKAVAGLPASEQEQPQKALAGKEETVTVQGQWQPYHAVLPVPDLARYVVVSMDKPVANGEVWIDSVRLFVR